MVLDLDRLGGEPRHGDDLATIDVAVFPKTVDAMNLSAIPPKPIVCALHALVGKCIQRKDAREFVARQFCHPEDYPLRTVLIETLSELMTGRLMQVRRHDT